MTASASNRPRRVSTTRPAAVGRRIREPVRHGKLRGAAATRAKQVGRAPADQPGTQHDPFEQALISA